MVISDGNWRTCAQVLTGCVRAVLFLVWPPNSALFWLCHLPANPLGTTVLLSGFRPKPALPSLEPFLQSWFRQELFLEGKP